jgi:hypothetical protein
MAKKSSRPRTERRERDRALKKDVRNTERMARALPGGSRATPIEVPASSVVELAVRDTRCPQCNGALDLRGDRAESTARGILREVDAVCRLCHTPRRLWFRLAPKLAN